jgi:hypothetical protein
MAQISAGLYSVRITGTSFGKNKNDKMNVAINFELLGVIDGNQVVSLPWPDTRGIQFFLTSDKNAAISIESLRKIGWTGTDFNDFNKPDCQLIGAVLRARCDHEPFTGTNGQTRIGERWSFATGGGGATQLNVSNDDSVARQANTVYANLLKGTVGQAGKISKEAPPIVQGANAVPPPPSDTNGTAPAADPNLPASEETIPF